MLTAKVNIFCIKAPIARQTQKKFDIIVDISNVYICFANVIKQMPRMSYELKNVAFERSTG